MKSTPCLTKAHQVKQTVPTDINTSTPTRVSVYTESITCNPINTNHQSSASSLNQNKIQTRIKTIAESSAIPFQHKIQLPQRKSRINMHKSQKDGATILLDLLLIFLGLAAGLFFFFVALFIGTGGFSSAGPSSTGDTNLVYFFILLALFCIGAPFKKLINDL